MLRHALSRDRAVEHPAHAGTIEIGGGDAEADNPARKDVHQDVLQLCRDRLVV